MIYLCESCLPAVDHFVGPEDPRECVCCGKAEQCVEVDPKDLVLTLRDAQGPPLPRAALPSPGTPPALPTPSLAPNAPPLLIPLPPPVR